MGKFRVISPIHSEKAMDRIQKLTRRLEIEKEDGFGDVWRNADRNVVQFENLLDHLGLIG